MSRIRPVLTAIILFLLIGAGAAWILSNDGVFQNAWAPSLGAAFSVLGVLVAFVQWSVPLPSSETKPTGDSAKSSQARGIYSKQIYERIAQGYGALVIYEKNGNTGKNVSASHRNGDKTERVEANIVEQIVNNYPLFAAVFHLRPNTYHVSGPDSSENITVFPGQVAEVDWRRVQRYGYQVEREEKRRKRATSLLRAKTVLIGLGGVLFLAHRFLLIPSLDIVGISFMALGVVNLVTSFVLDWLGWLKADVYRIFVFGIEIGGVLFFVHKYTLIPSLDIVGIIVMALSVLLLIGAGIVAVFD